jgi:AraC-like DNA-binding protein
LPNNTALFLRPEWAFQVAREVERFVRSLRAGGARPPYLDGFLTSLPVPERELEHQLIQALRQRLAGLAQPYSGSPAERARQLLVEEYQQPWTLEGLARAVGCNRTTLQEAFRSLTRTSVHRFLVRHRVSIAKQLLTGSDLKVSSIAQEVGYRSHSAFARHFKSLTGSTLTTYRVTRNGSADRERVPVKRAPLAR